MGTVSKVEENLSALENLLGAENVEDIKKKIGDLIVYRISMDLKDYDRYLFYPPDYEDVINSSFERVQKKISKMYADVMLEVAQEAVQRFKDVALTTCEQPGIKLRSCYGCEHKDSNKCKFYDDYYWKAHDGICAEEGFINRVEKKK